MRMLKDSHRVCVYCNDSMTKTTNEKESSVSSREEIYSWRVVVKLQRLVIRNYKTSQLELQNQLLANGNQYQKDGNVEGVVRCLRELVVEERKKGMEMQTRFLCAIQRLKEVRVMYRCFLRLRMQTRICKELENKKPSYNNSSQHQVLEEIDKERESANNKSEKAVVISTPSPKHPHAKNVLARCRDADDAASTLGEAMDDANFWQLSPDDI